jgi:TetR/AcrR family transcriptional regulator
VIEPRTVSSRLPATDRRRQLLEAALDVFSRKGFEGSTTKEIAAAAGVTEAIVFRHFPSKQALYAAILEHQGQLCASDAWLEQIRALMERNDDEGILRALASAMMSGYRNDARFERLMLFAALEGHEQGLAHHRRWALPVFGMLHEYFHRRQNEGALREANIGAIVLAIAGTSQYYAMMTQMFGYTATLRDEEMAEQFTGIVLNGIRQASVTPEKGNS